MSVSRTTRVAELVQAEVAELLLREVKDPRVRGVVITGVRVSGDLRQASVRFSRYGEGRGSEEELREGLAGLERSAGFLHQRLRERLRLRRIPRLRFYIDRNPAYSDHINRLLRGLKADGGQEGP